MTQPVEISFRPAMKSDCRMIVRLYTISLEGVSDHIGLQMAGPGEDILNVGQRRYEKEDSAFSYKKCTVAVAGDRVIGMLVAFPMYTDNEETEEAVDPVLAPYSRLEENDNFYICNVSVFPESRRRGSGHRFLKIAEQQAGEQGFKKLRLIVVEQNTGALKLYKSHGYQEVAVKQSFRTR
ncbi:MAG: GNAT family N-acetyltransferase [Gammaproteobacteria bacterium]|nr:GNAT family N-acetyltransferase [Gammaproteobacteria bacterium]NIP49467.1 GNAT family N-acetyltransferase [Gammaproteobacteria bacterium]NIR27397.1 GNAT family N-acetyltransferase [Gammaproteobacteria bacterium]NIT04821.1 GNAT family N-acetyltransferase [Gammaproteobacteria bacterium]NIT40193.1 GNAT family N-acetyltransferase [Gammaproteobacteria bacterium]